MSSSDKRKILLERHLSDEKYEVYITLESFKATFWDSTKPPVDAYIISLELFDAINKEWVSKRELGNWSDTDSVFTKASDKQVAKWFYYVFEVDLFIDQLFIPKSVSYITAASPSSLLVNTKKFSGYNILIDEPKDFYL